MGVFLALLLAMVGAGVYALARRKVKDTVPLLTVVCLIANLVAMIATAGYVRMRLRGTASRPNKGRPGRRSARRRSATSRRGPAETIFQAADLDQDGKLSADEAAAASTRFVQMAEAEAGKPLAREALANAIKGRVRVFDTPSPGFGTVSTFPAPAPVPVPALDPAPDWKARSTVRSPGGSRSRPRSRRSARGCSVLTDPDPGAIVILEGRIG